jgi:hypothetical protein
MANHDQDPDPHGSALVWLLEPDLDLPEVKGLIRIRIKTNADPQHCPVHKLR